MSKSVCVYCASSADLEECFLDSAYALGRFLAENNYTTVYGCGGTGLMGKVADGALDHGGKVVGIIPGFMIDREWAHHGVTEMITVDSMHERKARMEKESDAFVILPGGCGTFEEAWEIITWKRLDLHDKPICVANLWDYYNPLIDQLEMAINNRFLRNEHRKLFEVKESIEEVNNWVANC